MLRTILAIVVFAIQFFFVPSDAEILNGYYLTPLIVNEATSNSVELSQLVVYPDSSGAIYCAFQPSGSPLSEGDIVAALMWGRDTQSTCDDIIIELF